MATFAVKIRLYCRYDACMASVRRFYDDYTASLKGKLRNLQRTTKFDSVFPNKLRSRFTFEICENLCKIDRVIVLEYSKYLVCVQLYGRMSW